jgi:hypothetical protein
MVIVKMTSTVYYGPRGAKRRYGPGDAVEVPEGLAVALGLTPVQQEAVIPPPAQKPAPSAKPVARTARPRKAR